MATPVKPSPVTIVLGACVAAIIAAGLYLFHSTPATDGLVQDQQRQLAERDRIIAELRSQAARSATSPQLPGESLPQPSLAADASNSSSTEMVALQERLEATMQRLEQRMTQMEERLLRAKLISMTAEQRATARKSATDMYGKFKGELEDATKKARQIAVTLNVPETVAKLAPAEGLTDPRFEIYRPYFDARFEVQQAQKVVDATMNEISRIAVEEALQR